MNWNSPMEVHYQNHAVPYNSIGSFVDFFGGLTSDHVNFISTDAPYAQESSYYAMNTNLYKFAVTELESSSHYESAHGYVVNDHIQGIDEYSRHLENPPVPADDQATAAHVHEEENLSSSSSLECPRNQQNTRDYEVVWEDNIDPDNMSYEELLELGEAVGTQSRGLSEDFIALLPISKFKRGLFSRKKFKGERCVVCQMEYKRGDRQMTLPCKHIYHAACGSRWLSINKACPICYKEVAINVPKH
ncbi:E3 ubiquitin ligase BIG BROTHER-like isoform X2 [Olea europaea var. sylvestris]|uniref:E3 ubiquitin ligase BIG BROTHER-like isoform X2 n=1 Tax=Olea europaea var. sylvestris TaxID=158386 RepID=UPI000C1CD808|nr:E3 ubiquitin ligase BIG BROTHER-like isoform X2 [Olea europaea var. sylvestris]